MSSFWLSRSSSLEDERLYSPLEVAFLRGQVTTFSILLRAGADIEQFRLLLDVTSVNHHLYDWMRTFSSSTSSAGAQSVASMTRCLRHRLRQIDMSQSAVTSLTSLCVRPALQLLTARARNSRVTVNDVIAALSPAVTDDVRQLLTFSHLDDVRAFTSPPSSVSSPTSPHFSLQNNLESPFSGSYSPTSPSNDVTAKSSSTPQDRFKKLSRTGQPSINKKPINTDINNNKLISPSSAHKGDDVVRSLAKSKMPTRPKSCLSERYSRKSSRTSTTPRCADDINITPIKMATTPQRRQLPIIPKSWVTRYTHGICHANT